MFALYLSLSSLMVLLVASAAWDMQTMVPTYLPRYLVGSIATLTQQRYLASLLDPTKKKKYKGQKTFKHMHKTHQCCQAAVSGLPQMQNHPTDIAELSDENFRSD